MKERKRVCIICGKPFEFAICETCKAHIQGEALERKLRIENTVRVGQLIEVERRESRQIGFKNLIGLNSSELKTETLGHI